MANVLAWLTGREDNTPDPWPFQPQQPQAELRAYNPTPSERIGQWLQSGLMGLGADRYRAGHIGHGVRDILQATPLGIGMSAADVAHAKAADDPMGVAAAALGMVPGARPAGRALKAAINPLKVAAETPHEVMIPHPTKGLEWIDKANLVKKGDQWFVKEGAEAKPYQFAPTPNAPAPKQVLDYEKDDNGLYHIFDAVSGKTLKVVDSQFQAKQYIAGQKGTAPWSDFANPELKKTIPINQIVTPSPKEIKAPNLLEAQKRYKEAVAPIFQNLPERAVQQGYTTPAFRGLKIREGDVAPVHNFDKAEHQYATANPMLADMYADYLNTHPGWHVPSEAFDKGASVAPLLLDTSKYHYYDAAGAHWSSSRGNARGIREAREKGAPGVIVDNVWDEPNSTHALGTPSKIFITFPSGASTVKSRFAERFDPTSPDMLKNFAGLAAGGTGLVALLGSDRAEAAAPQRAQAVPPIPLSARINEIIDSLDWQDQWMGRMRLPLQPAAERRRNNQ